MKSSWFFNNKLAAMASAAANFKPLTVEQIGQFLAELADIPREAVVIVSYYYRNAATKAGRAPGPSVGPVRGRVLSLSQ